MMKEVLIYSLFHPLWHEMLSILHHVDADNADLSSSSCPLDAAIVILSENYFGTVEAMFYRLDVPNDIYRRVTLQC